MREVYLVWDAWDLFYAEFTQRSADLSSLENRDNSGRSSHARKAMVCDGKSLPDARGFRVTMDPGSRALWI